MTYRHKKDASHITKFLVMLISIQILSLVCKSVRINSSPNAQLGFLIVTLGDKKLEKEKKVPVWEGP